MENNDERFIGTGEEYKFTIDGSNKNPAEKIFARKQLELQKAMEKYMPIGSVVTTVGSNELKMIIGFKYNNQGQEYDYLACKYPYGIDAEHTSQIFNHSHIDRVYYIGYVNELEKTYKSELDQSEPVEGLGR